jgi:hypothetical protein
MDSLPFFYYDILSRIMPGAVTLAVLSTVPDLLPPWLLSLFKTNTSEGLEKLAVPVVLAGLCYMIGLLYEVVDYWYPMVWIAGAGDERAFLWVLRHKAQEDDKKLAVEPIDSIRTYRDALWRELEFKGATESAMSPMFAHCHRFQAEQKMFLHLIYPSLLFSSLSFWRGIHHPGWIWSIEGWLGLGAAVLIFLASNSRSRRRWVQTLVFCRKLGLRDACVLVAFPPKPAIQVPIPASEVSQIASLRDTVNVTPIDPRT